MSSTKGTLQSNTPDPELIDAEEAGKMKTGVVNIRMHLSHRDIGLLTGSARQTATTTLNEFRSMGLIDFSRRGITIKQFEKLQLLAK